MADSLFFISLFILLLIAPLWGRDFLPLIKEDIRPTMEEILKYHIEAKRLTPTIAQRAIKNFVQQFDPGKIYLLQSEITPFLGPSENQLNKMVMQYELDEFETFIQLNQVIQNSIERGRSYREELMRELILERGKSQEIALESYLHFASSKRELKRRIKKELLRTLQSENNKGADFLTLERKEKVMNFLEKQTARREITYLTKEENGEYHLTTHILKALATGLDAHTAYYTPEEAFEMRKSLEKEFEGVGVVLKEDIDGVVIIDLLEGSPAKRSGKIFPGDLLAQINKQSVVDLSYDVILDKMKRGNKFLLGVVHQDGTQDNVELKKERIELVEERAKIAHIPFAKGVIGKIELPSFYESTEESSSERDLIAALRELRKEGELLGLVLDLRENLGGFLSQAVKVAGLFISNGVIVVSKYAKGEVQYLRDINGKVHYNGPLVILTSKASASAAEIVAQSLQDYGVGLVVGDKRTYGKGSIQFQTITDEEAKAFFKVTVGRYYTVSGRSTQIEGVRADVHVPTLYSAHQIGERYLDYPLAADRIDPSFVDPLVDLHDGSKRWFQKYYLPNLQRRTQYWRQMLPTLENNTIVRLAQNPDFQLFLRALKKEPIKGNWGVEDLQMREALEILRDMIILHQEKMAAG